MGYAIFELGAISFLVFFIISLAPGSALDAEISRLQTQGDVVSGDRLRALEKAYGVGEPWIAQYGKWVSGLIRGDFGTSFSYHMPVGQLIGSRLLLSICLALGGMIIAWAVAIPIGVYSATHRYNLPDYVLTVLQFVGVAIPEFILALAVMTVLPRWFNMDVGGLYSAQYLGAPMSWSKVWNVLGHLWPPLLVIAVGSTAWLSRVMRANLLDVLNQQYIETARAKGVIEHRVVWKHAFRNSLHPLVMTFGTTLATLISGEAIVSIVFGLPTTGQALLETLINKDVYVSATLLVLLSALLVVGNLLADIALTFIDPRVKAIG